MSMPELRSAGTSEVLDETGEAAVSTKIEGRSPWRLAYERLRKDRAAKIALGTILVIVLLAILAPVFAKILGHGPNQQFIDIGQNANGGPVPPNGTFWLGTDNNGRDLFVRILYGARISLLVGVLATGISVVLGVLFGLTAGYIGGFVDTVIARFIDVMLSIPFLILAISIAFISGASLWLVIGIIGVLSFTYPARIVRGQVISIKGREFVEAARALGARPVADHVRRHSAERDGPGHRVRHAADPAGDRGRGVAVVPRRGRAAADRRLGVDDQRRVRVLPVRLLVVPALPLPGPADYHAGLQHLR